MGGTLCWMLRIRSPGTEAGGEEGREGHRGEVLDPTEGQEDKEFTSWRAVMEKVLKLG